MTNSELLTEIQNAITTNGNGEITGAILQAVLTEFINRNELKIINLGNEATISLDPSNYNAFKTNGSSIFISIDNVNSTDSNLLLQNNSASLRCYSATAQVEVTAGSGDQGLYLDRNNGNVTLINNDYGDVIINAKNGDLSQNSSNWIRLNSVTGVLINPTSGKVAINNLPTSPSGLGAGELYTQTATELGGSGTNKVICIV